MGDRAVIVFKSDKTEDISPAVYTHWGGERVRSMLELALPRMRQGDEEYSAARFVGVMHEHSSGNSGLGIFNRPREGTYAETLAEIKTDDYSHGNAGVFLVDVDTWLVECYNGYGFDDGKGNCSTDPLQLNADLVGE